MANSKHAKARPAAPKGSGAGYREATPVQGNADGPRASEQQPSLKGRQFNPTKRLRTRVDATEPTGRGDVEETPREALFLAGKVFLRYRQRSRTAVKRNVLPGFFIGTHAALRGLSILTRHVRQYRTYFPTVELVSPKR